MTHLTSPNEHLLPHLEAYSNLKNPGFALLVHAPWGAGKTHSIEAWRRKREDCLYVSLYGSKDSKSIEEALFDAVVQSKDFKPPKGLTGITEGIVEKFTGVSVDITGYYRRIVLNDVPRIVIFDDLERADMPPNELLSVLNQYVEHQKRNVILLANQDELRRKNAEEYDHSREKVIGRIVSIDPDVSSALDCFFERLEETSATSAAISLMKREEESIRSVFEASGTNNLRLLRCAMFDFEKAYKSIPPDLVSNEGGMKDLISTFFALSIAYQESASFELDKLSALSMHLPEGDSSVEGEKTDPSEIDIFRTRFQDHPNVYVDGSLITDELAKEWIGRGYSSEELVASTLRNAPQFSSEDAEDWRVLFWWRRLPPDTVEASLEQVVQQLDKLTFTDPAVILHVTGVLLGLADHEVGFRTRADVTLRMKEYISASETAAVLPCNMPERRYGAILSDGAAFGLGFAQRHTEEFLEVSKCLGNSLEKLYWQSNPCRMHELIKLSQENIMGFVSAIDGNFNAHDVPDYSREPVLVDVDPQSFAKTIFNLPPEHAGMAISPFEDRLERLSRMQKNKGYDWPSEKEWMRKFKTAAEEEAKNASPVAGAQIRTLLAQHMSFLEKED